MTDFDCYKENWCDGVRPACLTDWLTNQTTEN